jgi:acetylornithine deacetylase
MPATNTPREMIAKLVSFDTTSRNSNLELIEFVEDYLAGYGARCTRFPNEDGSKTNLLASIGPDVEGGIILSGHTDVVPVDGQPWVTDPWVVTEKDGKLFGRGTSDMKSFSAIALAFVPQFAARDLKAPIHLALSYDEEVGCTGVPGMIAALKDVIPAPRCAIIGEPTNMKVVNANKGIRSFRTTVTGKESHSSLPANGANAILFATELINHLVDLSRQMIDLGDRSGRFDPGYTTVSVGVIEGGTAVNITPRECSFTWEYRPLPFVDQDCIIDEFQSHVDNIVLPRLLQQSGGEGGIETEDLVAVPGLDVSEDCPAEQLALKLTGANHLETVSYGAEAGLFQIAGIPSVICGPGSITEAHKPNEFITLEQVGKGVAFFENLLDEISR